MRRCRPCPPRKEPECLGPLRGHSGRVWRKRRGRGSREWSQHSGGEADGSVGHGGEEESGEFLGPHATQTSMGTCVPGDLPKARVP